MEEIRLAHKLTDQTIALHNGPGFRWILWTQGCQLLCTQQCLNPTMLSPKGGYHYTTQEMIETLELVCEKRFYHPPSQTMVEMEGITLLGGEPTDQAKALLPFCKAVHQKGLSIMLYSGMEYNTLELHKNIAIQNLLRYIDILVDGPFKSELYDDHLMWRGSSNQKIHLLSSRYSMEDLNQAFAWQGKGVHFHHTQGTMAMSGIQLATAAKKFSERMR